MAKKKQEVKMTKEEFSFWQTSKMAGYRFDDEQAAEVYRLAMLINKKKENTTIADIAKVQGGVLVDVKPKK